jgi:hypothetical protein
MRLINLKKIYRKLLGYSLIILFCGYLGSITFFPHTHIIDGVTVVHSHPYKSNPVSNQVNHDHLKNGFLLIQFVTNFIATVSIIFFGVSIIRNGLNVLLPDQDENLIPNLNRYSACLPRGPTLLLQ